MVKKSEIGRILHLKSEIGRSQIGHQAHCGRPIWDCPISDL